MVPTSHIGGNAVSPWGDRMLPTSFGGVYAVHLIVDTECSLS